MMGAGVAHFNIALSFAFCALASQAADAQRTAAPAPVLVITHATVIDGASPQPQRDMSLLISGGRIERIAAGAMSAPPGAVVIDLKGAWLLPGLIDAHAHIRDLQSARVVLASGVTTARSLGVDHFTDIGVRELNRAGVVNVPDVIAAGYHVRPRPADGFFLDNPGFTDLMGPGISGPESVRRMVRAQIERGVDAIKIMATERAGLPDTDPRKRVYTEEELSAAVDEARKSGKLVAAHAHGDEGAAAAVRAGVRTIEHGTYLSDETLSLMKARGTCFVPTIATVIDLGDVGGDYDNPVLAVRSRIMLPRVRETTTHAWKLGVPLVAGTDTPYGPESTRRVPDELLEFLQVGLSPMDAIKSATSVAARCLGVDQRTGQIKVGLEADLIAVDRDPLADIGALRDPVLVVNNGRIAINRLSN